MSEPESSSTVHVVNGEQPTLASVSALIRSAGFTVKAFPTGGELLASLGPQSNGCVLG